MKITITFRQIQPTEALKNYIHEKLAKIEKYLHQPVEAHVVLSVERYLQSVEINLQSKQFSIHCEEQLEDMYASIDSVVDKLNKAARRHKDKVKGAKSGQHSIPTQS